MAKDKTSAEEQLAGARALYMAFDPDSPPWAIDRGLLRVTDHRPSAHKQPGVRRRNKGSPRLG